MQLQQRATKLKGLSELVVLSLPKRHGLGIRNPSDAEAKKAIADAQKILGQRSIYEQGQELGIKDREKGVTRDKNALHRAYLSNRFLMCFASYCRNNPEYPTVPYYLANATAKPGPKLFNQFCLGYQSSEMK